MGGTRLVPETFLVASPYHKIITPFITTVYMLFSVL